MHTLLLVFEFLGTTELLVIAVVALILFGPRKLPEIGRTVGRGLAEFKRASDDFKRTWEYEVEIEQKRPAPGPAGLSREEAAAVPALPDAAGAGEQTVARAADPDAQADVPSAYPDLGPWDVAAGRARGTAARPDEGEHNAS